MRRSFILKAFVRGLQPQVWLLGLVSLIFGLTILGLIGWAWHHPRLGLELTVIWFVLIVIEGAFRLHHDAGAEVRQLGANLADREEQIAALEATKPRLVFKGTEIDRDARAVAFEVIRGERVGYVDPTPASWSRVRIANDPGDRAGSVAQDVAALVTFFEMDGLTQLVEIEGRWASEKQAPEMDRIGLSKEGRTVHMPANGDDHFPLDIAMKFDGEPECYAYNDENGKSGSMRLAKHRLVGTDFNVRVRVKGTNTERLTGWFRLRNLGAGQPVVLQISEPPHTQTG